jgi:hypothetical protein
MLAMAQALTDGAGLAGLVATLRRITGEAAAFLDRRGSVLASSPSRVNWPVDEVRGWSPDVSTLGEPPCAVYPVRLQDDVVTLLVVPDTYPDRSVFLLATELATLELSRGQALLTGRRELASQVLEDLVSGTSRGSEARTRLQGIGVEISPAQPYSVILGRCRANAGRVRSMPWNLNALLFGGTDPYVSAILSDDLVLAAPVTSAVDNVAYLLLQHLRTMDPSASVGIGPPAPDPASLAMSYFQARSAAIDPGLTHAGPLHLGYWVLGSADKVALEELSEQVMEPLLTHDQNSGSEHLRSLETYINHGCSISAAADALFIHRNTLRYRLNLVTEMTGWSPDTFEGRLHFWIALRGLGRSSTTTSEDRTQE